MEKKLLITIAVLVMAAGSAMAQPALSKGGGFVHAGSTSAGLYVVPSPVQFAVSGGGGYFLADRLALLGVLNFGLVGKTDNTDSRLNVALDVGARYYFGSGVKGAFFTDALLGVSKYGKSDANFGLTINGGYSVFINDHVSFDPMLQIGVPFKSGQDILLKLGCAFCIHF